MGGRVGCGGTVGIEVGVGGEVGLITALQLIAGASLESSIATSLILSKSSRSQWKLSKNKIRQ